MEGPLLVLKSWMLTAFAIWIYRRWFQRVAPRHPEFEAFCAERPIVGAVWSTPGREQSIAAALSARLGKARAVVATLGGYPWPHYKLTLAVELNASRVLLRVVGAEVLRARDVALPPLASVVRDTLNELSEDGEAWLCAGAFNNGLVQVPAGGWSVLRGSEKRPRLTALESSPIVPSEPAAAPTAARYLALESQTPRSLPYGTA